MRISLSLWVLLVMNLLYLSECTTSTIQPVGSAYLTMTRSNLGETTFYQFMFRTATLIQKQAKIQVIFPSEYRLSDIPESLTCYLREDSSSDKSYKTQACSRLRGNTIQVDIGQLNQGNYSLQVGQITNPTLQSSSSAFRIRTLLNDIIVDSNEIFGQVSFAPTPASLTSLSVAQISNTRISEGASYRFTFQTSLDYTIPTTIRFTFPEGYKSNYVLCDVLGLFGTNPKAIMSHNLREVSCQLINKTLLSTASQQVTIINIINPENQGVFTGFMVEVMEGDTSIVKEKRIFGGSITVNPGQLTVDFKSSNLFKAAGSATYIFFINLVNRVDRNGKLYVEFGNDWKIVNPACYIISGVPARDDETVPVCYNIPETKNYVVENFKQLSSEERVILQFEIDSPQTENNYIINFYTYNTPRSSKVDENQITIPINATYGINKRFKAHPMRIPIKLQAGKTGPLELTFFLKTQLPQTNVGTLGRIRIQIFPAIPLPDEFVNGILRCYFYGDVPAKSCSWNLFPAFSATCANAGRCAPPQKTEILITTPELYDYKESEIPITITTDGATSEEFKGINLDPLIKRYIFHIHFYKEDVALTAYDEYYFTEFVPDSQPLVPATDLAGEMLVSNENTLGYFLFQFTQKRLTTFKDRYLEFERNYKLRLTFLDETNSSWSTNFGYPSNTLVRRIPCIAIGTLADTNRAAGWDKISCDLNTYNSLQPVIEIYGIQTKFLLQDNTAKFYFAQLQTGTKKLGQTVGQGRIRVEVLEETPGFMEPEVLLYSGEQTIFTSTSTAAVTLVNYEANPPGGGVALTATLNNTIINKGSRISFSMSFATTGYQILVLTVDSKFVLTDPRDLIVSDKPAAGDKTLFFAGTKEFLILKGTPTTNPTTFQLDQTTNGFFAVTNPPYEDKFTFTVKAIKNNVLTEFYSFQTQVSAEILDYNTISFGRVDTAVVVDRLTNTAFKLQFTTVNPLPDDWSLKLQVTILEFQSGDQELFFKTNLLSASDEGVIFERQTSQILNVKNLKAIPAATVVQIEMFMRTPDSSPFNSSISITTYYQRAMQKRVDYYTNFEIANITQRTARSFADFNVYQPLFKYQAPKQISGGYKGYFQFQIAFSATTPRYVDVALEKSSSNGFQYVNDNLMMLCRVGAVRYYCTVSNSNTTFLIVTIDLNGLAIVASTVYTVVVDTEFGQDYEGIRYPVVAGYYEARFTVRDSSSTTIAARSIILKVELPDFGSLEIQPLFRSQAKNNIFEVRIKSSIAIPAYTAGGRIQVEFPTKDALGNLFPSNLGYAGGTESVVGCWVDTAIVARASNTVPISCRLTMSAENSGQPAYVDLVNFGAIAANTEFTIQIAKIENPNVERKSCQMAVRLSTDSEALEFEYHQEYTVLLDIVFSPVLQTFTYTGTTFEASTYINSTDYNDLLHKVAFSYDLNLIAGDYFIAEIPSYLTIYTDSTYTGTLQLLPQCSSTDYDYCRIFLDINWIVWKLKANTTVTAASGLAAPIDIKYPGYTFQTFTTFNTYIYTNRELRYLVYQRLLAATWDALKTTFTSTSLALNTNNAYREGRIKMPIKIAFTTQALIPSFGSIQISFGAGVSKLYQNCRSSILDSSVLKNRGAGRTSGAIGCQVQDSTTWVLTGFSEVASGSSITVTGYVDFTNTATEIASYTISSYYDSQNHTLNTTANTFDLAWNVSVTSNINITGSNTIFNISQASTTCNAFYTSRAFYVGESFKLSIFPETTFSPYGFTKKSTKATISTNVFTATSSITSGQCVHVWSSSAISTGGTIRLKLNSVSSYGQVCIGVIPATTVTSFSTSVDSSTMLETDCLSTATSYCFTGTAGTIPETVSGLDGREVVLEMTSSTQLLVQLVDATTMSTTLTIASSTYRIFIQVQSNSASQTNFMMVTALYQEQICFGAKRTSAPSGSCSATIPGTDYFGFCTDFNSVTEASGFSSNYTFAGAFKSSDVSGVTFSVQRTPTGIEIARETGGFSLLFRNISTTDLLFPWIQVRRTNQQRTTIETRFEQAIINVDEVKIPSSIYSKGLLIGRFTSAAATSVTLTDLTALRASTRVTFLEYDLLRVNYQGPLRLFLQFNQVVSTVDVYLPKGKKLDAADTTNGFQYQPNYEKFIYCYFENAETLEKLDCAVTDYVDLNSSRQILVRAKTQTELSVKFKYVLYIDMMDKYEARDANHLGIRYPISTGLYEIQVLTDSTNGGQLELEVFGPEFTSLTFRSYVPLESQMNILDVRFQPSVAVAQKDFIVLEIPTISSDDVQLFYDSSDYLDTDFEVPPYDVVSSSITSFSMNCRFYRGRQLSGQPTRIACTDFSSSIAVTDHVQFCVQIKNPNPFSPDSSSYVRNVYVPIRFYSVRSYQKLNYNFIRDAIWIADAAPTVTALTTALPTGLKLDARAQDFFFQLTQAPTSGGTYNTIIAKFSFKYYDYQYPSDTSVITSQIYSGGYTLGTTAGTGSLIFCKNISAYIIKLASSELPAAASAITINKFYTPIYRLETPQERNLTLFLTTGYYKTGYAFYHNVSVIPFDPVEITDNTKLTLEFTQSTLFAFCDGKFTFKAKKFDLVRVVSITFPSAIAFRNQFCMQNAASDIKVLECHVDIENNRIWVTVFHPKTDYNGQNELSLVVNTFDLGIELLTSPLNKAGVLVKFYGWADAEFKPSLNPSVDSYVIMKSAYASDTSTVFTSSSVVYQPEILRIPHERYADDLIAYSTSHYAPIRFEFKTPVALSTLTSTTHQIVVFYASSLSLGYSSSDTSTDIKRYTPRCYVNNVVAVTCVHDSGNKKFTLTFRNGAYSGDALFIKITQKDEFMDEIMEGFAWTSTTDSMGYLRMEFTPNGGSTYLWNSEATPFYQKLSSSPPVNCLHSLGLHSSNTLRGGVENLIGVKFRIDSSCDTVRWLELAIDLVDEEEESIFTTSKMHSFETGQDYPCWFGESLSGSSPECILRNGVGSGFGVKASLFVTGFTYTAGSDLVVYVPITNPDAGGPYYLNARLRGFGGSDTAPFRGGLLIGEVFQEKFFETSTSVDYQVKYYSPGSGQFLVTPQGKLGTTGNFRIGNPDTALASGSITLTIVRLEDSSGNTECELSGDNSTFKFYKYASETNRTRFAYLYHRQGAAVALGQYYTITGVKCTHHYIYNWISVQYGATTIYRYEGHTVDLSAAHALAKSGSAGSASASYRSTVNGTDSDLVISSIDLTVFNSYLNSNREGMILGFRLISSPFLQGTADGCDVLSGISAPDARTVIDCEVETPSDQTFQRFVVRNFDTLSNSAQLQFQGQLNRSITQSQLLQVTLWSNQAAKEAFNEDFPQEGHPLWMQNYTISLPLTADTYNRTRLTLSAISLNPDTSSPTLGFTFAFSPSLIMNDTGYRFKFTFQHQFAFDYSSCSAGLQGITYSGNNQNAATSQSSTSCSVSSGVMTIAFNKLSISVNDTQTHLTYSSIYNYTVTITFSSRAQFSNNFRWGYNWLLFQFTDASNSVKDQTFQAITYSTTAADSVTLKYLSTQSGVVSALRVVLSDTYTTLSATQSLMFEFVDNQFTQFSLNSSRLYATTNCWCASGGSESSLSAANCAVMAPSYKGLKKYRLVIQPGVSGEGLNLNCLVEGVLYTSTTVSYSVVSPQYIRHYNGAHAPFFKGTPSTSQGSGSLTFTLSSSTDYTSINIGATQSITFSFTVTAGTDGYVSLYAQFSKHPKINSCTTTLSSTRYEGGSSGSFYQVTFYSSSMSSTFDIVCSVTFDKYNVAQANAELSASVYSRSSDSRNYITITKAQTGISPLTTGLTLEVNQPKFNNPYISFGSIFSAQVKFTASFAVTKGQYFLVEIADASSQIDQFSGCNAFFAGVSVVCNIADSGTTKKLKVTLLEDKTFANNDVLWIYFSARKLTAQATKPAMVLYFYTSSEGYTHKLSSVDLPISETTSNTNLIAPERAKVYPFAPRVVAGVSAYAPFRFFFKQKQNTTLINFDKTAVFTVVSDTAFTLQSGYVARCFLREYKPNGGYVLQQIDCTYTSGSKTLSFTTPYLSAIRSNRLYEFIFESYNYTGYGPAQSGVHELDFTLTFSSQKYVYFKEYLYTYTLDKVRLRDFQYTSDLHNTRCDLFMSLIFDYSAGTFDTTLDSGNANYLAAAQSSTVTAFPDQFIQIEFPSIPYDYNSTFGQQAFECYTEGLVAPTDEEVRCLRYASAKQPEGYLVVRIENMAKIRNNRIFTLALDDLLLPTITDDFVDFNFTVKIYQDGAFNEFAFKHSKTFESVFVVRKTTTSPTTATNSTTRFTASSTVLGQSAITFTYASAAWAAATTAWSTSARAHKIVLDLRPDSTVGGLFNFSSQLDTGSFQVGATTLTLLWRNKKTQKYVFAGIANASATPNFVLSSLKNPNAAELKRTYCATDSCSPYLKYRLYGANGELGNGFLLYPARSYFTARTNYTVPLAVGVLTNGTGRFYNTQEILVQVELTLPADFTQAYTVAQDVQQTTVEFTSGVTRVSGCYHELSDNATQYANVNSSTIFRCSLADTLKLHSFNMSTWFMNSTATAKVRWWVRLVATSQTLGYSVKFTTGDGTVHSSMTGLTATVTGATLNTDTVVAPDFLTFDQQRYLPDHFTIQQSSFSAAASLSKTFFRLLVKTTATLTKTASVTDELVVEIDPLTLHTSTAFYRPNLVTTNPLQCYLTPYTEYPALLGLPFPVDCVYDSAAYKYTVTTPLNQALLAGNYELLVEVVWYSTDRAINYPTAQHETYFKVTQTVSSTSIYYYLPVRLEQTFTKCLLRHSTISAGEHDFIDVTIRPPFNVAAPGAAEELLVEVELNTSRYKDDLGYIQAFSEAAGEAFVNGQSLTLYAGDATTAVTADQLSFHIGQYSVSRQNALFVLALSGALSTTTDYTFRLPMIENPKDEATLSYTVRLVQYKTGYGGDPYLIAEKIFVNEQKTAFTLNQSRNVSLQSVANSVAQSSGVRFSIQLTAFDDFDVAQEDYLLIYWDARSEGIPKAELPEFAATNFSIQHYPQFQVFWCKATTTQTASEIFRISATTIAPDRKASTYGPRNVTKVRRAALRTVCKDDNITLLQLAQTSGSITRSISYPRGLIALNSYFQATLSLTTGQVLTEGGYILVNLNNAAFTLGDELFCGIQCELTGSLGPRSTSKTFPSCYRLSDSTIRIRGYAETASAQTFTVSFCARTNGTGTGSLALLSSVQFWGSSSFLIREETSGFGTATVVASAGTALTSVAYDTAVQRYYVYAAESSWINFEFTIRAFEIEDQTHELALTLPSRDKLANTANKFTERGTDYYLSFRVKSTDVWINQRVSTVAAATTATKFKFKLPDTNSFPKLEDGVEIECLIYTQFHDTLFDFLWPAFGRYDFTLESTLISATNETKEILRYEYQSAPRPKFGSLSVEALNNFKGRESVYRFTFDLQEATAAGDRILIFFETHNEIEAVFDPHLGRTAPPAGYLGQSMDCSERPGLSLIQGDATSSRLDTCFLFSGDAATRTPGRIEIPITQVNAAGVDLDFYIAPIKNPTLARSYANVKLQITRACRTDGQRCVRQQGHDYLLFVADTFSGNYVNTVATHTYNMTVGTVYDGVLSSLVFSVYLTAQTISTSEHILVLFPSDNQRMTKTCTGGSLCVVFPTQRWILFRPSATLTTNAVQTFTISNVQAGWYRRGGAFQLQFWSSTYAVVQGNNVVIPQYGLLTNAALNPAGGYSVSFNSTLCSQNSYVVREFSASVVAAELETYANFAKGHWNVIQIRLTGFWRNADVKQIWVEIPSSPFQEIDQDYCNATFALGAAQSLPYPLKLFCAFASANLLRIDIYDQVSFDDGGYAGWTAAFKTLPFLIYFKAYIYEDIAATVTPNYVFYSQAIRTAAQNDDFRIGQMTGTHALTTMKRPDLNYLTFNTISFHERKGLIRDPVEIYMLLEPKTLLASNRINKLVFRVPDDFAYPPILNLDDCTMIGKVQNVLSTCRLDRLNGTTFVTVETADYDHSVKIVRLSDRAEANLFVSPALPGSHYRLGVDLYKVNATHNLFLESSRVNLSYVLGNLFDLPTLRVYNGRDSLQPMLFEFQFTIGSQNIFAGYNTNITTIWSSIHLIFEIKLVDAGVAETLKGYPFDLGTGLGEGEELGCVAKSGLTLNFTRKLTCRLHVGTNSTDLPQVIVTGYDAIRAGTSVSLLLTGVQTLGVGLRTVIRTGIQYNFNRLRVDSFIQTPTSYIPEITSARAETASASTPSISFTGSNEVLGLSTYTFSLTLEGGPLTPTDYFVLEFPRDYFERFTDYSGVTCGGQCSAVFVFGISNLIYVQPSGTIATGAAFTFTVNNLINPAYAQDQQVTITGRTQVSQKYQRRYTFVLNRNVLPCSSFAFTQAVADSQIGGSTNVRMKVFFQTGHRIPASGAVSVRFPPEYTLNLITMNATCRVPDGLSARSSCRMGAKDRLDLILGGNTLDPEKIYTILVEQLTLPNFNSAGLNLQISTHYNDNIYQNQRVCSVPFAFPPVVGSSIALCSMITNSQFSNTNELSLYTFSFQCPQIVTDGSVIEILFNSNYLPTNRLGALQCYSQESTTLASKTCTLSRTNTNQLKLTASLLFIQAQVKFTIQAHLTNPSVALPDYKFSASILQQGIIKARSDNLLTVQQIVAIVSDRPSVTSAKLRLANIPKNAGAPSTYIFSVPPLNQNVKQSATVDVQFPQTEDPNYGFSFASELGSGLQCGVYYSLSGETPFVDYVSLQRLFALQQDAQFQVLPCSILSLRSVTISNVSALFVSYNPRDYWYHWIVKNVQNPSRQPTIPETFRIKYLDSNLVNWKSESALIYKVSAPPAPVKLTGITLTDKNIKRAADYQLTLKTTRGQDFQLVKSLGVSVRVLDIYQESFRTRTAEPVCKLTFAGVNQTGSCQILGLEVLLTGLQISSLSQSSLQLWLNGLVNPTQETACASKEEKLFFFQIYLLDLQSGDLLYFNTPSVDDVNCVVFTKTEFNILVNGPNFLQRGLTYTYNIDLEAHASGLTITPTANVTGVRSIPEQIQFQNYLSKNQTFQLYVRGDVIPGIYRVEFTITQTAGNQFYLPILPIIFNVVEEQQQLSSVPPTITIKDFRSESIGQPLKVLVQLSQPVSNLVQLIVSLKNEEDAQYLDLSSTQIDIPTEVSQVEFQLTMKRAYVPPAITLNFRLSSFYPIIHTLTSSEKSLYFSRSTSGRFDPPLLVVYLQDQRIETQPIDLNKSVLTVFNDYNSSLAVLRPVILEMKSVEVEPNRASFLCSLSSGGTLYYVLAYDGAQLPGKQAQIREKSYEQGLRFASQIIDEQLDVSPRKVVQFALENLESQTNFIIFLYALNQFGESEIFAHRFKTGKLSYGIRLRVPMRSFRTNADIQDALSKTLRIASDRIVPLTSESVVQAEISGFNSAIMISPTLYFEFAIAPNRFNDDPQPIYYFELLQQVFYQKFLKGLLPEYEDAVNITVIEYRNIIPRILVAPSVKAAEYNQITIETVLQDSGVLYGIILPKKILNPDVNPQDLIYVPPNSIQIFRGLDQDNKPLSAYHVKQSSTDSSGKAQLIFQDLIDGKDYEVFLTIGNDLPYNPKLLLNDQDIIKLQAKTPVNYNLKSINDIMVVVKGQNPELALALEQHIAENL